MAKQNQGLKGLDNENVLALRNVWRKVILTQMNWKTTPIVNVPCWIQNSENSWREKNDDNGSSHCYLLISAEM